MTAQSTLESFITLMYLPFAAFLKPRCHRNRTAGTLSGLLRISWVGGVWSGVTRSTTCDWQCVVVWATGDRLNTTQLVLLAWHSLSPASSSLPSEAVVDFTSVAEMVAHFFKEFLRRDHILRIVTFIRAVLEISYTDPFSRFLCNLFLDQPEQPSQMPGLPSCPPHDACCRW